MATNKKQEESAVTQKGKEDKTEYHDIEKSPIYPTGLSVAGHESGLVLTFYFNPPEDEKRMYVLARVGLDFPTSEKLSKALKEAADKIKNKRPEEKK